MDAYQKQSSSIHFYIEYQSYLNNQWNKLSFPHSKINKPVQMNIFQTQNGYIPMMS